MADYLEEFQARRKKYKQQIKVNPPQKPRNNDDDSLLTASKQGLIANAGSALQTVSDMLIDMGKPQDVTMEDWKADLVKNSPFGWNPVVAASEYGEQVAKENARNYAPMSPNSIAYSLAGVAPYALALGATGVAASRTGNYKALGDMARAGAGQAITKASGIPVFGATIARHSPAITKAAGIGVPAMTVGAMQTVPEAMFERQSTMDEYIADAKQKGTYVKGQTEAEARELGNRVAMDNIGLLTGANTLEQMLFANSPVGKASRIFKKVGVGAGLNAAEEGAQTIFPMAEAGEKWDLTDPRVMEAMLVGGAFGGVAQGAGEAAGMYFDSKTAQTEPAMTESKPKEKSVIKANATSGNADIDRIIEEKAKQYGIDPNLVHAVIQQESGYRPAVESSAGAVGLMQLMPGTASDLGVTDRTDPEQNIDGGIRYLKQMYEMNGGDWDNQNSETWEAALASYNGGYGNRNITQTRLYAHDVWEKYNKIKGESTDVQTKTEVETEDTSYVDEEEVKNSAIDFAKYKLDKDGEDYSFLNSAIRRNDMQAIVDKYSPEEIQEWADTQTTSDVRLNERYEKSRDANIKKILEQGSIKIRDRQMLPFYRQNEPFRGGSIKKVDGGYVYTPPKDFLSRTDVGQVAKANGIAEMPQAEQQATQPVQDELIGQKTDSFEELLTKARQRREREELGEYEKEYARQDLATVLQRKLEQDQAREESARKEAEAKEREEHQWLVNEIVNDINNRVKAQQAQKADDIQAGIDIGTERMKRNWAREKERRASAEAQAREVQQARDKEYEELYAIGDRVELENKIAERMARRSTAKDRLDKYVAKKKELTEEEALFDGFIEHYYPNNEKDEAVDAILDKLRQERNERIIDLAERLRGEAAKGVDIIVADDSEGRGIRQSNNEEWYKKLLNDYGVDTWSRIKKGDREYSLLRIARDMLLNGDEQYEGDPTYIELEDTINGIEAYKNKLDRSADNGRGTRSEVDIREEYQEAKTYGSIIEGNRETARDDFESWAEGYVDNKLTADRKVAAQKAADTRRTNKEAQNKKTVSVEENIANGKKAMQHVIETHEDVDGAMYREDVGDIDFVWGSPGGPPPKFKKGSGIAHIIAKRSFEGIDGEKFVLDIPTVIAKGTITKKQTAPKGDRVSISHDEKTVVLSLYKDGERKTWVVSGWDESVYKKKEATSSATAAVYDANGATSIGTTRSRSNTDDVAFVDSTISQEGENVKKEPPNDAAEMVLPDDTVKASAVTEESSAVLDAVSEDDGFLQTLDGDERESVHKLKEEHGQDWLAAMKVVRDESAKERNSMLKKHIAFLAKRYSDKVSDRWAENIRKVYRNLKEQYPNITREELVDALRQELKDVAYDQLTMPYVDPNLKKPLVSEKTRKIFNELEAVIHGYANIQTKADEYYKLQSKNKKNASATKADIQGKTSSAENQPRPTESTGSEIAGTHGASREKTSTKRKPKAKYTFVIDAKDKDIAKLNGDLPSRGYVDNSFNHNTKTNVVEVVYRDEMQKEEYDALLSLGFKPKDNASTFDESAAANYPKITKHSARLKEAYAQIRPWAKKQGVRTLEKILGKSAGSTFAGEADKNKSPNAFVNFCEAAIEKGYKLPQEWIELSEDCKVGREKYSAGFGVEDLELEVVPRKNMTEEEVKLQEVLGETFGVDIIFCENADKNFNGFYNGKIYVNRNSKKDARWIVSHELTHHLANREPKVFRAILEEIDSKTPITDKQIEKYRERIYKGDKLSEDDIIEEMVADEMNNVLKQTGIMKSIAKKDPSLAERIVEVLNSIVQKLRELVYGKDGLNSKQGKALEDAVFRLAGELKDVDGNHLFSKKDGYLTSTRTGLALDENSVTDAIADKDGRVADLNNKMDNVLGREVKNSATYGSSAAARLRRDEKAFGNSIDALQKGTLDKTKLIKVMHTPLVMQLVGAKDLPIKISSKALHKIIDGKHYDAQSLNNAKQLPSKIADPIAIFKSKTRQDSHVVMLEIVDENGSTYIAPVALNKPDNDVRFEVNLLTSAYGKGNEMPNDQWFVQQADNGRLVYVNTKKALAWSNSRGVQFPKAKLHNGAFLDSSISAVSDSVNTKEEGNKEKSTRWAQAIRVQFPVGSTLLNGALSNSSIKTEADLVNLKNQHPTKYSWFSGKKKAKPKTYSHEKIVKETIEKLTGLKVAWGHIDENKNVVYDEKQGVIRSRDANNWRVVIPKVAEAVMAKLNVGIKQDGNKKTADPAMRDYITDYIFTGAQDKAETKEAKAFADALQKNPEVAENLEMLKAEFDRYNRLSRSERAKEGIEYDTERHTTWGQKAANAVTTTVDEYFPIYQTAMRLGEKFKKEGKELPPYLNPYILARNARGAVSQAAEFINLPQNRFSVEGTRNKKLIDRYVKSVKKKIAQDFPAVSRELIDSFKPLELILADAGVYGNKEKVEDLTTFMVARRMLELHERNERDLADMISAVRKEHQDWDDAKVEEEANKRLREKRRDKIKLEPEYTEAISEEEHEDSWDYHFPEEYNTKEKCKEIIEDLETKEYAKAADEMYALQALSLEIQYDSGLLGRSSLEAMKKDGKYYIPLHRVIDDDMITKGDSTKKLKGSSRRILSPLEAIAENVAGGYVKAQRNKALAHIAQTAKHLGEAKRIELVDNNKPQSKNVVSYFVNGKRSYIEAEHELAAAMARVAHPAEGITLGGYLTIVSRWCRGLMTTHNPEFAPKNFFRDALNFFLYLGGTPIDVFKGIKHTLLRDAMFQEYQMSGASQSVISAIDKEYFNRNVLAVKENGLAKKAVGRAAKMLQAISEFSENAIRVAAYEKVKNQTYKKEEKAFRDKLKKEGKSKAEIDTAFAKYGMQDALDSAFLQATYESRDLMDFGSRGDIGATLNRVSWFANAILQGGYKSVRAFNPKDPVNKGKIKNRAFRLGLIVAAQILLAWQAEDDDEITGLSDADKFQYFHTRVGDTIIRIPKGEDLGLRALTYYAQLPFDKRDRSMLELSMPMRNAMPDIMGLSLLKPIMETYINYSFFYGGEIVPERLQNPAVPAREYDSFTSKFARDLGEQFNWSPKKIDYLMNGYFGGLGRGGRAVYDWTQGKEPKEPPIIRQFTVAEGKTSVLVGDAYDKIAKQEGYYKDWQDRRKKDSSAKPDPNFERAKYARIKVYKKRLQELSKKIRENRENEKIPQAQRDARNLQLIKRRNDLAEKILFE